VVIFKFFFNIFNNNIDNITYTRENNYLIKTTYFCQDIISENNIIKDTYDNEEYFVRNEYENCNYIESFVNGDVTIYRDGLYDNILYGTIG
jgi:hypothetical protein